MKLLIQLTACLIALPLNLMAETKDVTNIHLIGPYSITKPFMTDSLDSEGKQIDLDEVFMDSPVPTSIKGEETSLPFSINDEGFYFAGFSIQNTGFAKGKVNVKCESKHKLYIDGNELGGDFELVPGRHEVCIKLLVNRPTPNPSLKGRESSPLKGEIERVSDTLRVSVESEQALEINPEGKRYWTNADMMHGERINGVEISSSGKYVRIHKNITYKGGETEGKDIFIADDIISSGESVIDLCRELKRRNAARIFVSVTYAFFTDGVEAYRQAHEEGIFDYVFSTNLTYRSPELLKQPWYVDVDMSKYLSLIIATLNHDRSLSTLLNPLDRINRLMDRYGFKRPQEV